MLCGLWLAGIGTSASLRAKEINHNIDTTQVALALVETDNGQTFTVVEGQQVVARLDSNPTTGYGWTVVMTDKSFGYPQESFEPPTCGLIGAGGVQVFTWETKGPFPLVGEHQVRMAYLRPWETQVPAIREFAFTLKILPVRPACGNPALDPNCQKAKDETTCTGHGGWWTPVGLNPNPTCVCSTPDAGCPCTAASDCTGMCLAPWGSDSPCNTSAATCSSVKPMAGCFCLVMDDGQAFPICID